MSTSELPHIRKYGRGNGKLTECGAPATRNDVRSTAWLKPFTKCPACTETIRLRMAAHLSKVTA